MPAAPVRDIKIHPRDNDIIVATHGRGIYILDDAAPFQQLAAAVKSDAYLFPVRPAIRWAGSSGMFRQNERDWIAPNPPAGAYINVYLKAAPSQPLTITVADKAGKTVRTLRNLRSQAGVNRFVWDLRWDNPAARPDPAMADIPVAIRARFGIGSFGPAVLPGEYVVKVSAGGRELTSPVVVQLDPGVTVPQADLQAQIDAAFAMLSVQQRVNTVIDRVDDLMGQLTALDAALGKQTPAPAVRPQVKQAMDTLKAWRDEELARPLPGLGYRQYPRLREDVQSVSGYINRGFKAPNAGETLRMKELTDQTAVAEKKLAGIETGAIAAINTALKEQPRIR
jgi:hypothetical protein